MAMIRWLFANVLYVVLSLFLIAINSTNDEKTNNIIKIQQTLKINNIYSVLFQQTL